MKGRHAKTGVKNQQGRGHPGTPRRQAATADRPGRAGDIRERLGWETDILNGSGWKPKGMRWGAYERLTAVHDAFVQVSLAGMAKRFESLKDLLEGICFAKRSTSACRWCRR